MSSNEMVLLSPFKPGTILKRVSVIPLLGKVNAALNFECITLAKTNFVNSREIITVPLEKCSISAFFLDRVQTALFLSITLRSQLTALGKPVVYLFLTIRTWPLKPGTILICNPKLSISPPSVRHGFWRLSGRKHWDPLRTFGRGNIWIKIVSRFSTEIRKENSSTLCFCEE